MAITSGRQIAAARALLGLSCIELAELLGCGVRLVTDLEKAANDGRAEFQQVTAFFESVGVTTPDCDGELGVFVSSMSELQAHIALELRREEARRDAVSNRRMAVALTRAAVLRAFDEFRGTRSARSTAAAFLKSKQLRDLWRASGMRGCPSYRTLTRWRSASRKGGVEALAPQPWAGGRKPKDMRDIPSSDRHSSS